MSSGKSSSSSSTSTQNQDLRVGADNGAIALGQGSQFQINNQFPDTVATAFLKLVDLASGAGQLVADTSKQINEAQKTNREVSTAAINALTQQKAADVQGTASVLPQIAPYLAAAAVAIVIVIYLMRRKK